MAGNVAERIMGVIFSSLSFVGIAMDGFLTRMSRREGAIRAVHCAAFADF
jgi:hypothetical protein